MPFAPPIYKMVAEPSIEKLTCAITKIPWLPNAIFTRLPYIRRQPCRQQYERNVYARNSLAVPNCVSAESLYDMVGMDIFATEARVGNMANEIVLDSIKKDLPKVDVPGVPPLLVINVQLPSAPPALMSSAEDGPGYQVR